MSTIDSLYLYDPEFETVARAYAGENSSSESWAVKSIQDLKDAGNAYTSVKFLMFMVHGLPGKLVLQSGGQIYGFQGLFENTAFVQPEARVLFASCCVGAGDEGDKFMDSAGKYVLGGKGGFVGASTVKNGVFMLPFANGPFMVPLSFGRLKVKHYDGQGNVVGSRMVDRHGIQRSH